jgi:uncharacterized protein YggU (UPF0235/DUF167 family)
VKRASDGGAAGAGAHYGLRATARLGNRSRRQHGDCPRIRLAAPPVDNAANRRWWPRWLEKLGFAEAPVRLVGGLTSPQKRWKSRVPALPR